MLHNASTTRMPPSPPTFEDLPPLLSDRKGWPWTEQSDPLPETQASGDPWPKISIVTPSYNQGQYIEETIRSVLLQGYPNLEYIVIDGGSTDGSVEIIEKYERWIDHWVSEPDEGHAHAILKGLEVSTGEEIEAYLNSDDVLLPGALAEVGRTMTAESGAAWGTGDGVFFSDDVTSPEHVVRAETPQMPHLIFGLPFIQQSTFWRAEARKEVGFDPDWHFGMDVAFFTRLQDAYGAPCFFDGRIGGFRVHQESKTSNLGEVLRSDILELARYWERQYSGWDRLQVKHARKMWEVRQAFISYYVGDDYGEELSAVDLVKIAGSYPPGLFQRQTLGAIRRLFFSANNDKAVQDGPYHEN